MKNFGKSSRVHSQGVQKIFMAPIYGAHCAVIFATAQLSAVALNGVRYMNVSRLPNTPTTGIYTYIVEPSSCIASEHQYFDTHNDDNASQNLISYLQDLTSGIFTSFLKCLDKSSKD